MLIAVVSDTHRSNRHIDIIKQMIKECDLLLHLGDNIDDAEELKSSFKGKTHIVAGNCDFTTRYPKEKIIDINGKKIFMTHGDLYAVKMSLNSIYYRGKETGADVVVFGHSHMGVIERTENMTLMNPGSPSLPRLGKGTIGFIYIDEDGNIETYLKEVK